MIAVPVEVDEDADEDELPSGEIAPAKILASARSHKTEKSEAKPERRVEKEMLFSPRKARPSGNVLEVVSYWEDTILDVELFHPSYKGFEQVLIGDPTKAHFLAGGEKFISRHVLARMMPDGYRVRTLPDMKIRVRKGGEVKEKSGKVGVNLKKRDIAHISHGAVKYFLMFVTPPELNLPPNRSRDPIFAALLAVTMLMYLAVVPFLWMAEPKPEDDKEDDIWAMVNVPEKEREQKVEQPPPPPPPKPEQKVAEKKVPPPKPKPVPPPPKPVTPAKPVEKPKPQQKKPVEKPTENNTQVAANKEVTKPKVELSEVVGEYDRHVVYRSKNSRF